MESRESLMANEISSGRLDHFEGESYIIVKAAPRRSHRYGETVCVAGLNADGSWVRLYPISFVYLDQPQRFSRWDKVRYRWSRPNDPRSESRHVDPNSIQIIGKLPRNEVTTFLNRAVVSSLTEQRKLKRSLALIRPEILNFNYEKKKKEDVLAQFETNARLRRQLDLLAPRDAIPNEVCPFDFKYHIEIRMENMWAHAKIGKPKQLS